MEDVADMARCSSQMVEKTLLQDYHSGSFDAVICLSIAENLCSVGKAMQAVRSKADIVHI